LPSRWLTEACEPETYRKQILAAVRAIRGLTQTLQQVLFAKPMAEEEPKRLQPKIKRQGIGVMGMLRTTFILGAILFAMPSPPQDPATADQAVPMGNVAYIAAAADAFGDVRNFCARKPFVCETAGQLASSVERKAKYSAKLIYEWANDATSDPVKAEVPQDIAAMVDAIETGSTVAVAEIQMLEIGPFLVPADVDAPQLRGSIRPD
jgi:Family of unknown function (DUF5330)